MESNSEKPSLKQLQEQLLDSAKEGDLSSLQAIVEESQLEKGEALINGVDEYGLTVLHRTCLDGYLSVVKWLLSDSGGRAAGFNCLLAKTSTGATAFHIACREGHLECVQAIVEGSKIDNGEREALINATDENGWTVLHEAICYGHATIVEWLLSDSGGRAAGLKSSTITAKTNRAESALHCGGCGSVEGLQALLTGCTAAEKTELFQSIDDHGWTALHWAVGYGHPEIIRELLLHHPETQMIVDRRDHRGMTALHRAVIGGIDEESRKEWRFDEQWYSEQRRKETVEALLMTIYPSTSQPTVAQIDPNVGLKFE